MINDEIKNRKEYFIKLMQSQILSGQLKPGDRLPPERELAEECGISRGSINQGILDLERMGFLRIVPRKGTYVAEYVRNATPETLSVILTYDSDLIDRSLFMDFMDLRILVERECVRLVCETMNIEKAKILEENVALIYDANMYNLANAVFDFHHSLVELSENGAFLIVFQSFSKMLKNMIQMHYSCKSEVENCLPIYGQLLTALCQSDEVNADKKIRELLDGASIYLNKALSSRENKNGEQ